MSSTKDVWDAIDNKRDWRSGIGLANTGSRCTVRDSMRC